MLRQRGYSTWLLKAAIIQPKVFIVARDTRNREYLVRKYSELIDSYARLSREQGEIYIFSRDWPRFILMDNIERSIIGSDQHIPVLFDNSCFYG